MSLTPTREQELEALRSNIRYLTRQVNMLTPLADACSKWYKLWLPDHKDEDELHAAFNDMTAEMKHLFEPRPYLPDEDPRFAVRKTGEEYEGPE